ncbi:MAG TPA: alpha/beta hydrolase [Acidimicrobiales bacterium]|nr:alpha/beta hydrolase [Acidimicrobiales bacterium]
MSRTMDEDFLSVLEVMPSLRLSDPKALRALLAETAPLGRSAEGDTAPARATTRDFTIPSKEGHDIRVRLYEPVERDGTAPGLAYFHGGAFVLGDLEVEHGKCLRHAADGGAVVLSVDYRLAPEHPYPAGLEDCYTGLVWLADHAEELGVDPARLAVGGSSAGGNLAAAVALLARDRGGPPLAFQLLIYPVTDDRTGNYPSMAEFAELAGWNGLASRDMWDHYLGPEPREVSAYAAPARAEDLRGLPPAFVITAEFDPLRDEGMAYAIALQQAGVPTELHHVPGVPHGFDLLLPEAAVSRRAIDEQVAVLRRHLAP